MNNYRAILILAAVSLLFLMATGCMSDEFNRSTDARRQDRVNKTRETEMIADLQHRKRAVVDEPNLTDFRPADMFARTLEEQDKGIRAFAYILNNYTNQWWFVCEAAAFPYPGGTQYTAPEVEGRSSTRPNLPQADPNGLYTPATAAATIAPCWATDHDVNNTGNGYEAGYFEENINVFPSKLPDQFVVNPDVPLIR